MKPAFWYHSCWNQTRLSSTGQYLKVLWLLFSVSTVVVVDSLITLQSLCSAILRFFGSLGDSKFTVLTRIWWRVDIKFGVCKLESCQYASSQLLVWIDLKAHYDGCGSGGRGVHLLVGMLVGLRMHVEESLGRYLTPSCSQWLSHQCVRVQVNRSL